MTKTIDELKQIFMKEQKFLADNHLELACAVLNGLIAQDDNTEKAYNALQEISKKRMDAYKLTEEEMKLINDNRQAWALESVEYLIHKFENEENNDDTKS